MSLCLMCKEIKESDLPFSKVNLVNRMQNEHLRGSSVQKVGMSHWNGWKNLDPIPQFSTDEQFLTTSPSFRKDILCPTVTIFKCDKSQIKNQALSRTPTLWQFCFCKNNLKALYYTEKETMAKFQKLLLN